MGEHWLVYSREHNAFWGPNNCGYTHDLADAGRYSKAEAEANCDIRDLQQDGGPSEIALPAPEAFVTLTARVSELEGPLLDLEEYFDGRADAEYSPDSAVPHPNEEMKMLCMIRELDIKPAPLPSKATDTLSPDERAKLETWGDK